MRSTVAVRALRVDHGVRQRRSRILDGVDMEIESGQAFGLVGESGSGKSTLAMALTRYLPHGSRLHASALRVAEHDVLSLSDSQLRAYRRDAVGVVYQEPGRALNPTMTSGAQVAEAHRLQGVPNRLARQRTLDSLAEVGLAAPDALAARYPHELSGGEQQRVMIAMALAARPRLLILDEPTASLDRVSQEEVWRLIAGAQREVGFASLVISHDPSIIADRCDRAALLEGGVLSPAVRARDLGARSPRPLARRRESGRPSQPQARLGAGAPGSRPAVLATNLSKRYGSQLVVDDVSFRIDRGETLGVVGASGSGKTTLGRILCGLVTHEGRVTVSGTHSPAPVQMVFQSPDASLNPRRSVAHTLRRAVTLLRGDTTVEELLETVGLPRDVMHKLPSQLSGGQKQRVAIARAFAGRSPLIVCDEPTSALDARSQEKILDLLVEMQERTGVAYLFISHDLSVIERIAHRVGEMRDGRLTVR